MRTVTISAQLSEDQAQSFAAFLERAGFSAYRVNAADTAEAYQALVAGETIRAELAEAGFSAH